MAMESDEHPEKASYFGVQRELGTDLPKLVRDLIERESRFGTKADFRGVNTLLVDRVRSVFTKERIPLTFHQRQRYEELLAQLGTTLSPEAIFPEQQ